MCKNNATERPWFTNGNSYVYGKHGYIIIYCDYEYKNNHAEDKANATLIVRAVNRDHLFDELLELAKQLRVQYYMKHGKYSKRIDEVIAQANGDKQ